MSTETPNAQSEARSLRRVIAAGFTGTLIEWYDFVIFGTIAVLVFDKLFYPSEDPGLALLASLSTFAVGFIARPIGGVFFGYLGDKVGRRTVLVVTLTIMGLSTLGIGLLPTYAAIGVWAPVLLVILRLAQGFSLGGEWGGVATILIEHAPENKRAQAGSWAQSGGLVGPLVGTLVVTALTALLTHEQMLAWGWRIPFLFSVLLVLVSVYVRRQVNESPNFLRLQKTGEISKKPIREAAKLYPKQMFAVFAMHSGNTILFYTCITLSIAFLTNQAAISETGALVTNAVFLLSAAVSALVFGKVADIIGRKPVYLAGAISAIVMAFPLFWMYGTGKMAAIIPTAIVMGVIEGGLLYGIQPAYFGELFPTRYRLAGMNLGYQAATVAIGSTAPILGVLMLEWGNGDPWLFCIYLIAIQVLCAVGVIIAGETKGRNLDDLSQEASHQQDDRSEPVTSRSSKD